MWGYQYHKRSRERVSPVLEVLAGEISHKRQQSALPQLCWPVERQYHYKYFFRSWTLAMNHVVHILCACIKSSLDQVWMCHPYTNNRWHTLGCDCSSCCMHWIVTNMAMFTIYDNGLCHFIRPLSLAPYFSLTSTPVRATTWALRKDGRPMKVIIGLESLRSMLSNRNRGLSTLVVIADGYGIFRWIISISLLNSWFDKRYHLWILSNFNKRNPSQSGHFTGILRTKIPRRLSGLALGLATSENRSRWSWVSTDRTAGSKGIKPKINLTRRRTQNNWTPHSISAISDPYPKQTPHSNLKLGRGSELLGHDQGTRHYLSKQLTPLSRSICLPKS